MKWYHDWLLTSYSTFEPWWESFIFRKVLCWHGKLSLKQRDEGSIPSFETYSPFVYRSRTADSQSAKSGSIPLWVNFNCPQGVREASDLGKIVAKVQLLLGALYSPCVRYNLLSSAMAIVVVFWQSDYLKRNIKQN